jgi:Raf kinase inhibitor-like YbhB/YbcL family protein
MRIIILSFASLLVFAALAFSPAKTLVVTSTAFTHHGRIPVKYTCVGQQASPPLTIGNIPPETKSLAIIVDDPDAIIKTGTPVSTTSRVSSTTTIITTPAKGKKKRTATKRVSTAAAPHKCGYTNWIIWNIDVHNTIPENFKNEDEGMNSANQLGYTGVCPSSGQHSYHFRVFALDTKLNIPKNSTKEDLEKVMEGHILGKGELVGTFDKTYK